MSVPVVLHISYTLEGPTTVSWPHATRVVLLTGAVNRKTLCQF